ncbi:hypothetical protein EJ04DRAFT_335658 [Polyplosphaeria fusca]|uniref:Uncharacterized protein n=1 Tax=Polyplosphaeria fusca TaxID=682080 RepID=A0A9P4QU33_9PLEO|nr:hypothetical protein EJ04DRAFT_335658 [Polyplosphaeria fusca]
MACFRSKPGHDRQGGQRLFTRPANHTRRGSRTAREALACFSIQRARDGLGCDVFLPRNSTSPTPVDIIANASTVISPTSEQDTPTRLVESLTHSQRTSIASSHDHCSFFVPDQRLRRVPNDVATVIRGHLTIASYTTTSPSQPAPIVPGRCLAAHSAARHSTG